MLFIVTVLVCNNKELLKVKDIKIEISASANIDKKKALNLIKKVERRSILRIMLVCSGKKKSAEIYNNYKVLSQLAGDFLCNMWLYNIIWERSEF